MAFEAPTQKRHRLNDLASDPWRAFLRQYLREQGWESQLRTVINGFPLSESASRRLFAWLEEGLCPSVFKADEYLTAWDLHLDDYFFFCSELELCPWARSHAPDWWEAE
jgi:hypothetical protein